VRHQALNCVRGSVLVLAGFTQTCPSKFVRYDESHHLCAYCRYDADVSDSLVRWTLWNELRVRAFYMFMSRL
jgi:hypothetical protein